MFVSVSVCRGRVVCAGGVVAALALACAAAGQVTTVPTPATPVATSTPAAGTPESAAKAAGTAETKVVAFDDLPAPLRLGIRADRLREQRPVLPIVVVVPDSASYIEAIARWSPEAYYPVLLYDSSIQGLEDVARFVRGFAPEKVVRWSYKVEDKPATLPTAPAELETLVERALARSLGAGGALQTDLIERIRKLGVVPPGLVVASPSDPAWTAALALAAGRAQPIAWVTCKPGVGGEMPPAEADALERAIENAAEKTGLSWRALGDDLDAIALCLNCPAKTGLIPGGPDGNDGKRPVVRPGEVAATTDRIGRFSSPADHSVRWAWASQIFGAERQAAYRAMCSLFLQPRSAWLFDGYTDKKPWSDWDGTQAGKVLEGVGYSVVVDDTPAQGRAHWRARCATPLEAGLVFVNSKGECGYFDLEPGRGRPGETPLMKVPTIVHYVHSWSLQYPQVRATVGGRWIDNGAYCFFGSVHEPFLNSFMPTPRAAGRIAGSAAWGAACRIDGGAMWRLACVGDPLMTLGPPAKRLEARLPFEGTEDVEAQFKARVKAGQFAEAIRLATMLGRDSDAARLAGALAADQPDKFTPPVALVALFPLARAGRAEALAAAFDRLDEKTAADAYLRDALWLGTMAELSRTQSKDLLTTLRKNLRPDQPARDALDLYTPWERLFGRPAALAMLTEVRDSLTDARMRDELDTALKTMK